MKKSFLILVLLLGACVVRAQFPFPLPKDKKEEPAQKPADRLDSLLSLMKKGKYKTRPYDNVITADAVVYSGLFSIYAVRDSFFFEIPAGLLNRDMELITRLQKGSIPKEGGLENSLLFPGESMDEQTVYFKLAPDSAINLLSDLEVAQAAPGSRIATAVANAYVDPVMQTFSIVAMGKDKGSYVLDATAFMKKEASPIINIHNASFKASSNTDIHIEYVHAYPINMEISIYRNRNNQPIVTNTSFIELSAAPMQQRLLDRRVGYMDDYVSYFSDDQHKVEKRKFIYRWRLEPRPEDRERWQRGELVEPAKPIVIYVDPHTPKQWVKYLIEGVNDWQKAFEQAGFKNAIMGKEWPYGDSANMDDARYSFICYLPAETMNAYGPNVHDPRTGEIIQTHVGWYHNVMSLLKSWYLIQAGAVDPRARKPKLDDDLMGELIRFVSSHEIGHTLGLRHNFGSSSRTPVEKLRDKEWLKQHGHTASIMDYARFDYVAQPEDNIPEELLWPHIGEYDRWAIEWGYKYSGAKSAEEDQKITRQWITQRLAANPLLWYGSQEETKKRPDDPRCQTEDLGDNNMVASAYGIKNLKRILPNLPAWCKEEGGQYENLEKAYKALTDQYKRYLGHVLTNLGGVECTYRSEDEGSDVFEPVSKKRQKEALAFFNDNLFNSPLWLLDPTVIRKAVDPLAGPNVVSDLQVRVVNSLLDTSIFNKLSANAAEFGAAVAYTENEYLTDLHHYMWGALAGGKPMDTYRRDMQKSYIGSLLDIITSNNPAVTETETYGLARADLLRVQKEMTVNLPKYTGLDRVHLESQIALIKKLTSTRPEQE